MNITKAKITKDNTLVASFKNENEDNVTIEGKNLIHKDLRAAFNELIPHLAFLCEQKEADGKDSIDELPEEIFSTFEVTGYTVSGSDDNEGVVLVGKRFLKSKKGLNLIAPLPCSTMRTRNISMHSNCSRQLRHVIMRWNSILPLRNGR